MAKKFPRPSRSERRLEKLRMRFDEKCRDQEERSELEKKRNNETAKEFVMRMRQLRQSNDHEELYFG